MLRGFQFWLIGSGTWPASLVLSMLWDYDQWSGGAFWRAGFASIVVGVLPSLALLPVALLLGWLLRGR